MSCRFWLDLHQRIARIAAAEVRARRRTSVARPWSVGFTLADGLPLSRDQGFLPLRHVARIFALQMLGATSTTAIFFPPLLSGRELFASSLFAQLGQ